MVSPESVRCPCPGDVLTYECTVVGGGVTVWKGSAFDNRCGKSGNELVLLHDRYHGVSGDYKFCEDGSIEARGVRVENSSYTSQLNVTLTSNITGKSIECAHDDGSNLTTIGSLNIEAGTLHGS